MDDASIAQPDLFDGAISSAARNRLEHFEDCASAIDELFRKAANTQGAPAFGEFLAKMKRFSNLSGYNAMLALVQRPGAIAVTTRRRWGEIGRTVSRDATPVVLLQPFGPVRFAFEYGDTEGEPIPEERLSSLLAEGVVRGAQYKRTCAAAQALGVEVVETDRYGPLRAGTAAALRVGPTRLNPDTPQAPRYRVRVNAKHDLPTRFATLAHELGHIYCGHVGGEPKGRWPDRSRLAYEIRELEAEAVAWLVCERTGVVSRADAYLASLVSEKRIGQVSMFAIFEAANRVEARTSVSRHRS